MASKIPGGESKRSLVGIPVSTEIDAIVYVKLSRWIRNLHQNPIQLILMYQEILDQMV